MSKKELKVDLRAAALGFVKQQAVQSTTRGMRKEMFLEMLKGKEMDRTEVIGNIAYEVYMAENPEATELDPVKFETVVASVKGSVANFCSKSKRKSTATATFNWDPAYKEWELVKLPGNKLTIIERETEFETFE